jgi:hypothetical protein
LFELSDSMDMELPVEMRLELCVNVFGIAGGIY